MFDAEKIAREVAKQIESADCVSFCAVGPCKCIDEITATLKSAYDAGRIAGEKKMRERAAKESDVIECAYDSTLPQKDTLQLESQSKARAAGQVADAIRALEIDGE